MEVLDTPDLVILDLEVPFEGLANSEGDAVAGTIAGKTSTPRESTAEAFTASCPPSSVANTAGSGFPWSFFSLPPIPLSVMKKKVTKSEQKANKKLA